MWLLNIQSCIKTKMRKFKAHKPTTNPLQTKAKLSKPQKKITTVVCMWLYKNKWLMTGIICLIFPGSYLSTGLTQQQQGSVKMTRGATGAVNNFITRPQPPLIEQKHTNNMEKHFLFLMSPCYHCHLKAGYPVCPWLE